MGKRHESHTLASVVCFLLLTLGTSCSGVKKPQAVVDAGQDPALAWSAHREYLVRVLESDKYEQPAFDQAINFFEDLTDIHSGLDASSLMGRILSPKALKSALDKWDHWYRENANRIRWDAGEDRYVVRKDGAT